MSLLKNMWVSVSNYFKKLEEERLMNELIRMEPSMRSEINAIKARQEGL